MRKYLSPDYYVNTYRDVTVDFLAREGIRYLILDIDNTLAPYEQPEPDEEHLAWFAALNAAGIRAVFVSNNKPARVTLFNERIGIPFFAKAGKPGRRSMRRAMEEIGAAPEETAMMGDQIFTDVWAGRRVGVRTILLPPIRDKRDLGTRLKRFFEKPILRYYRKHKKRETRDV